MNAIVKEDGSAGFLAMLERVATDPAIPLEKMERLLAMQERIHARQAEAEFNAALSRVQARVPSVLRNKHNEQTRSDYADLEAINRVLVPIYTDEGFALSFNNPPGAADGFYRVTCTVTHRAGHSREYQADIPSDGVGMKGIANKTLTHAFGSSMSYARRYLTLLIFNLTLANEDDDGNAAARQPITERQAADLEALVTEVGASLDGFLRYLRVSDLRELPAEHYPRAVAALETKRKKA